MNSEKFSQSLHIPKEFPLQKNSSIKKHSIKMSILVRFQKNLYFEIRIKNWIEWIKQKFEKKNSSNWLKLVILICTTKFSKNRAEFPFSTLSARFTLCKMQKFKMRKGEEGDERKLIFWKCAFYYLMASTNFFETCFILAYNCQ